MKKILNLLFTSKAKSRTQNRIVKFITLCLLITFVQANAFASSQSKKVSIKETNISLEQVFWKIQEQTKFVFVFSKEHVADYTNLDVDLSGELEEVLTKLLEGKNLSFVKKNNTYVIRKQSQSQDVVHITGNITDVNGDPIPGVNVYTKDGFSGAATDPNGNFALSVLPGTKTLTASFIGMKDHEIVLNGKTFFEITLHEDEELIEEVVVTGIVDRKASTFTGSVASYEGEALKAVSNSNVFESIKNLDPSLMIIDDMLQGSDPNAMPDMQLRGTSSFDLGSSGDLDIKGTYGSSANAPLFILDGFEASIVKILDLDMDRVKSVTILKDASAKTIYGSKAANGVIVVETKVNPDGKALVHYNGSISVEVPDFSSYNLMNAAEKLDFEIGFGLYGEKNGVWGEEVYQQRLRTVKEGVNTDWMSKPVQNGVGTKHRLGFELGDEALRLVAGFTYNNIQGVMKGSSRENYSGDIAVSYRYKKFMLRNQLTITSNISNDSPYGSFSEYARMNPYYSPYDKDGNLLKMVTGDISDSYNVANPLWNSQLNTVLRNEYLDVTNNLYANMYWNDYLRTSIRLGVGMKRVEGDIFYPAEHTLFNDYTTDELIWRKGFYQSNEGRSKTLSGDFNTTYSRYLGDNHYFMFNLGAQLYELSYDEVIYKAEGLPSEDMNSIMFAKQYAENEKPYGSEETRREISGLGILNYAYDNRYLFDASVRSSGSSQYGANKRWGTFWSVGVGWNVHEEDWLKADYIQRLKLRGSIGTTGSQIPDAYAGAATYRYILDKTYNNMYGLTLVGMRNDDLQWQQKLDKNIGLELNAFDKLSVVLDFYESTTKNTLIESTLAPSTGFMSVDENMGEVVNKGIDLKATYTLWSDPKERSYLNLMFNASRNKNEIRELSDAMKDYNERINALFDEENEENQSRPLNKYVEGGSMTSLWAVPSAGIDPANGREIFIKQDGTHTYNYSASDQRIVGNTLPDVHGNIGGSLQYKGFGVNLSFYYLLGAQMYNYTLSEKVEAYNIKYNVDRRVLEGAWLQPGDVKPYAKHRDYMSENTGNYTMRASKPTERFIFDRNELSLSSVNISYDFWKHDWIKKLGLSRLKVSAYGNNLYTWSSVELERGLSYPFARTFNFAVSATF